LLSINSGAGGAGGKGVVIVRYRTDIAKGRSITGGTITTSGDWTIHTFNDTSSLVVAWLALNVPVFPSMWTVWAAAKVSCWRRLVVMSRSCMRRASCRLFTRSMTLGLLRHKKTCRWSIWSSLAVAVAVVLMALVVVLAGIARP
jgi:hypothetical protein